MIEKTKKYIKEILDKSNNPIALCSFGKDSMVMLHLIRCVNPAIPVLFFKEPFYPKKYRFANSVIDRWDLTVYDFPPVYTDIVSKNNSIEVMNIYNGFGKSFIYLPTGAHKYKNGEPYLCLVNDLLNKPCVSQCSFPWDTIFIGHKNNDIDPIFGTTKLKDSTVRLQEMTLALPIIDWSDDDIWKYTLRNKVPYNKKRYNKADNFREFTDKTFNNDYHACCYKCVDNKESQIVKCPRTGKMINNVAITEKQSYEKIEKILCAANYVERI